MINLKQNKKTKCWLSLITDHERSHMHSDILSSSTPYGLVFKTLYFFRTLAERHNSKMKWGFNCFYYSSINYKHVIEEPEYKLNLNCHAYTIQSMQVSMCSLWRKTFTKVWVYIVKVHHIFSTAFNIEQTWCVHISIAPQIIMNILFWRTRHLSVCLLLDCFK